MSSPFCDKINPWVGLCCSQLWVSKTMRQCCVQRRGGKKFIALVPDHYCQPIACYSAHLSDFTCVYRKRRFSCSFGSFLAFLKGSGQKSKGRKFNAIPDFALPSHPVSGLFHHCSLVHAAPRPVCPG